VEGVEFGNAWQVPTGEPKTGWFVGFSDILRESPLRYVPRDTESSGLCIKWYEHPAGHEGKDKPMSTGRTLSVLMSGRFRLRFCNVVGEETHVLRTPGDFVIWGGGLHHECQAEEQSTVLAVRWLPA
jgi:hypothetical protein